MKNTSDKILCAVDLVLGVCLTAMLAADFMEERREEEKLRTLAEEAMYQQYEAVRLRLNELMDTYAEQTETLAAAQIVFTDLDERIYDEAAPLMESYGYTGVLAVSGEHYPGADGCLTEEQVLELTEQGWICCPVWEEDAAPEDFSALPEAYGDVLLSRDVVYFEEGAYTEEYGAYLARRGYQAAIHHGEELLPLVTARGEGELWLPGAVGLQGYQPRFRLEDAVALGRNIVFTVGYERQDELYEERPFASMLDYLDDYEAHGLLQMLDPLEALQYYTEYRDEKAVLTPQYEEEKAALEEELHRIRREMGTKFVDESI